MRRKQNFFQKVLVKVYLQTAEWLYHPFAWAYDCVAWLVSFGFWPRWRRDALEYLIPGPVLETGFGTGDLLIEMSRKGFDVTGLEFSEQMHRVTGRKLRRADILIKRIRGRSQACPFPENFFTNVLSTFPTNYIAHPDTLTEVHRILKRRGRWVLLGLGVRFKSKIKQFLVGWLMGDWNHAWIQVFGDKARMTGFQFRVIEHITDAYTLRVLILEKSDA